MDNKDLEKRILEIPYSQIEDMDAYCIKRLTDDFKEPLLRLLVGKAPTLEYQNFFWERIVRMWSYIHCNENGPDYFGDIYFDINCGIFTKQKKETSHNQPAKDTAAKTSPVDAELKNENSRLMARIKELEEENKKLEEELEEAYTLPKNVTAHQRVRMELARLIMEKAGVDSRILDRWGKKDKAGALMGTMLDIKPTTCKTYLSDPCLNKDYHKETIDEINPILEALELDIRL